MPPPPAAGAETIRLARPSDLRRLRDVEASGEQLFRDAFGDAVHPALLARPPEGADRVVQPGFILVAEVDRQVVGFAHVLYLDDGAAAHLEQLSVRPEHQRHGIGSRLVVAALEEARWAGYEAMSLCTYRDLPFNGPFYARLGFVEVERLEPYQQRLRDHERLLGLEENGVRVVMSRRLDRTGRRAAGDTQVTDE